MLISKNFQFNPFTKIKELITVMPNTKNKVQMEVVKFMLMVQDMERAVSFYCDTFGLSAKIEVPMWTELTFKNTIIALHGGGNGEHVKTGLSIQVKNLNAACKAVAAAGGKVIQKPTSRPNEPIIISSIIDTEGNEFMMTQFIGNQINMV